MACCRKVLDLPAAPREAACSALFPSTRTYSVAGDGEAVEQPAEGGMQLGCLRE